MPIESFLINPMRRRKVKHAKRAKRSMGGIKIRRSSDSLALRSNSWFDDRTGHSRASKKGWRRKIKTKSRHRSHKIHKSNPLGEEVIIMGANPRRKRKSGSRRTKRSFRLFKNAPKRRRSRRRTYHMTRNAPSRNRKRSTSRGSHRRNPVSGGLTFDIMRPQTLIMPLLTGLVAKIATEKIPAMLNLTTTLTKYGAQTAVAVGGSILLRRFVGRTNAAVWGIVSAVTILTDVVNRYVLKTALSSIGNYDYIEDTGAYPNEVGAFPFESERMLY